ncbi:FxLYD domain-containing protein [Paenibacillus sp. IHBB 10380]|uniref:FxLYD domain-containing protein n=1 Tax=Paenibacillus sp. IHBB 10380 TaxID=1566358 RepID=UPI0005CF94AD|nr:FxLYD domain-containing protein [Paenibacillus sp. IHBB 10380]AJS59476.1 hypothetical protein UB51_14530 [Paenibacillus sp. IHBB 10380]
MYCHVCGAKSTPGKAVCSGCGTKLFTLEKQKAIQKMAQAETATSLQLSESDLLKSKGGTVSANPKAPRTGRVFVWLIPILLLSVVGLALISYYKYEVEINRQVEALHQKAEAEAIAGHYGSAIELLDAAAVKRPGYQALVQDRSIAAEAEELQERLAEAVGGLKTQKLQASEATMKEIAKTLRKRQEPIFAVVKKKLATSQVKLAVMKVKSELDKLNTVSALAEKLDTVEKLEGQEAKAVKKQIINKLVGVSYAAAEKMLKNKDFAGALQAVDKGLSYAANSVKLSTYKKRIQGEKQAFEKAEEERIQLAEQQAAQEDLNNRTAAVDVTDIKVILDDYGDLQISGTVNNTATRPIYSINLNLAIYDAAGSYLGETYASVFPYRLEFGEFGEFTTAYYGVYEHAQVSVVNVTWYLE